MSNPYMIKTVECARCGNARQETNRWFALRGESESFRCRPLATASFGTSGLRLTKSEEPVCGQECAQKLFERYLAGESARRPARR